VASYSALPEPMLARSGPLPTRGDYAFEVKWDGFRAIAASVSARPRMSPAAATETRVVRSLPSERRPRSSVDRAAVS